MMEYSHTNPPKVKAIPLGKGKKLGGSTTLSKKISQREAALQAALKRKTSETDPNSAKRSKQREVVVID